MIDITEPLPDHIEAGGRLLPVRTDWRTWLRWQIRLEDEQVAGLDIFLARPGVPASEWLPAALEFARSENATPRGEHGRERVFDWREDGERVVAAFQQAYGIDVLASDMHWHRFLALFRGLPESCQLVQVMGYRGYRRPGKEKDATGKRYERLRKEWALPPKAGARERGVIEWQREAFGAIVPEV